MKALWTVLLAAACLPALAQPTKSSSTSKAPIPTSSEKSARNSSATWNQPGSGNAIFNVGGSSTTWVLRSKSNWNNQVSESEYKRYENLLNLNARYGISESLAIGVSTNTGKEESYSESHQNGTSSKSRYEGFASPEIFGMHKADLGDLSLLSRAAVTIPLGSRDCGPVDNEKFGKYNSSVHQCNRTAGGYMGSLGLGIETKGAIVYGAKIGADLKDLQTTRNRNDNDDHVSGGHIYRLGGYAETVMGFMTIAGELGYQHWTASVYSSDDYHSTGGTYIDFGTARLTANMRLAQDVELVPSVEYMRLLNTSLGDSNYEAQNMINASLSVVIGI